MQKALQYFPGPDHLQIDVDLKDCDLDDATRTALAPVFERLGRVVSVFPSSHLCLKVVHHPRSGVHQSHAKLKLPGKTISIDEQSPHCGESVTRCLEEAIKQAELYAADPDQDALENARRVAELDEMVVAPASPDHGALGEAFRANDYSAFRRALLSHEEYVRKRVGRWIQRYGAMDDQVDRRFKIADLVEAVFLTAFEQYERRPDEKSVSEWLDGLVDPAIKSFRRNVEDRVAARAAQSETGLQG